MLGDPVQDKSAADLRKSAAKFVEITSNWKGTSSFHSTSPFKSLLDDCLVMVFSYRQALVGCCSEVAVAVVSYRVRRPFPALCPAAYCPSASARMHLRTSRRASPAPSTFALTSSFHAWPPHAFSRKGGRKRCADHSLSKTGAKLRRPLEAQFRWKVYQQSPKSRTVSRNFAPYGALWDITSEPSR